MIRNNIFNGNLGSGVSINASNVWVRGNTFTGNHSGCTDNAPGGQVYVDTGSDSVSIQYNTIQNGPSCANGWWAEGAEVHGTHVFLHNNSINNNAGEGIYLDSAQYVYITYAYNDRSEPYYPRAPGRSIAGNNTKGYGSTCGGFPGIRLHQSSVSRTNSNITIDGLLVVGPPQTYGIQLDSCDDGSYTGPAVPNVTITNNCLAGNVYGPIRDVFNCGPNHNQACIGSGQNIANNITAGCGGY